MPTRNFGVIKHIALNFVFILLASSLHAKELKSDDLNYRVTIPDVWTVTFQNQAGFAIASPDGKRTIALIIGNARSGRLSPGSEAELERGLARATAKKISSREFVIDGVTAYETAHSLGEPPFNSSFISQFVIADGKLYSLQAMGGGDISQAPDVQTILASFHFLKPPKPPGFSLFGSLGSVMGTVGIVVIIAVVIVVIRSRKA